MQIEVFPSQFPNVSIIGLEPGYCENHPPVTLEASVPGGFFFGPGVNGNQFDPSAAAPSATNGYVEVTVNRTSINEICGEIHEYSQNISTRWLTCADYLHVD